MIAFVESPKTAKSVNALFTNPILVNLNKFQNKKQKFSTLMGAVKFVSSAKSVNESAKFLKVILMVKGAIPATAKGFGNLEQNIKFKDKIIKDYQMLSEFITWADKFEHDDKNMKALINNVKHALSEMDYIIDYVSVAIKSQEAINELKKTSSVYTVDQIKSLIAA